MKLMILCKICRYRYNQSIFEIAITILNFDMNIFLTISRAFYGFLGVCVFRAFCRRFRILQKRSMVIFLCEFHCQIKYCDVLNGTKSFYDYLAIHNSSLCIHFFTSLIDDLCNKKIFATSYEFIFRSP